MDEAKLESLLEEAIAHCYDEEEEFWGLFCALQMHLSFPLLAAAQGADVEIVGLDEPGSGLQQGVMVRINEGGQEQTASLSELEFAAPDPASAEWLAAYRYWWGKTGRG